MRKHLDLTGKNYGRLTVIKQGAGKRYGLESRLIVTWQCQCECGNLIDTSSSGLRSGGTTSCGCLRRENLMKAITTHNKTKDKTTGKVTKEYRTWQNMKARCENPNNRKYALYGGRAIKICERWREFANFVEDMGYAPSDKHSIDRIDNNGNYCPSNCKWSDQKTQINNRRNTSFIEYKGERLCTSDWSARTGVPIKNIAIRIRMGWDVERALFLLPRKRIKAKSQD